MDLNDWQKDLLAKGNCYTFAGIFCEKYPKEAKARGFKQSEYKSWCEFNDGFFTVWNDNGDKDFFDVEMNYCGTEEY